jgi:hypothetical protein
MADSPDSPYPQAVELDDIVDKGIEAAVAFDIGRLAPDEDLIPHFLIHGPEGFSFNEAPELADESQKGLSLSLYLPCELVNLRAQTVVAVFFAWQAPGDIQVAPACDPRRIEVLAASGRASDGYCVDAFAPITRRKKRGPIRGQVQLSRRQAPERDTEGALGDAIQCAFDYLAKHGDKADSKKLADKLIARSF